VERRPSRKPRREKAVNCLKKTVWAKEAALRVIKALSGIKRRATAISQILPMIARKRRKKENRRNKEREAEGGRGDKVSLRVIKRSSE